MEVKKYIDSVSIITVPENTLEIVRNNVSYRNNYYTLYNLWSTDTVSKKKTFHVEVLGRFLNIK